MHRVGFAILLIPLIASLQACTRWVAKDDPLDRLVETSSDLRIATAEGGMIGVRWAYISADKLYGQRFSQAGDGTLSAHQGYVFSPSWSSGTLPWRTTSRSDIKAVMIPRLRGGWSRTEVPLETLAASAPQVRLLLASDKVMDVRNWHVSDDSLFSEPRGGTTGEWIGVPLEEISTVYVRASSASGTLIAGIGIVAIAGLVIFVSGVSDLGGGYGGR